MEVRAPSPLNNGVRDHQPSTRKHAGWSVATIRRCGDANRKRVPVSPLQRGYPAAFQLCSLR